MLDLLDRLLTADPTASACEDLDAWWPRMIEAGADFESGTDRAIAAGFAADRLGWAFVAGYHHAVRRLVPALRTGDPVALAATEEGGGHPRAIATALRPTTDGAWTLDGTKHFVTLGRFARRLLVVASVGPDAAGRNLLRLVRVEADAPGVALSPLPATPFAPEIEHARATFTGVHVAGDDVLPGDGYEHYLKPFRTVEDLRVIGAALGYLAAVARRHRWPDAVFEDALVAVSAVRSLAHEQHSSPATHVALGGALRLVERVVSAADEQFAAAPGDEATRWARDRGLLRVADRVRGMRLQSAWRAARGEG